MPCSIYLWYLATMNIFLSLLNCSKNNLLCSQTQNSVFFFFVRGGHQNYGHSFPTKDRKTSLILLYIVTQMHRERLRSLSLFLLFSAGRVHGKISCLFLFITRASVLPNYIQSLNLILMQKVRFAFFKVKNLVKSVDIL